MRLLKRTEEGEISLTEVPLGHNPLPYAILSHAWGLEEISFQDLIDGTGTNKLGYAKIRFCGNQAWRDGWQFFWVDTCCIDKSNSTELQEAINSMFCWYRDAEKCYVYLSDLVPGDEEATRANLRQCRWFTRGWTLQELIAPRRVEFFDQDWSYIGSRRELQGDISDITRIHPSVLLGDRDAGSLKEYSIAHRMSWAAKRHTTLIEDMAYCLLGIFDVSMPLIYGEDTKAFRRLQEEIIKSSNDLTIFAWEMSTEFEYSSILAPSPAVFLGSADVEKFSPAHSNPEFTLNNKGLRITTSLWRYVSERLGAKSPRYFLRLGGDPSEPKGVSLVMVGPGYFIRDTRLGLGTVSKSMASVMRTTEIYVALDPPTTTNPIDLTNVSQISFVVPNHPGWRPVTAIPEEQKDHSNNLFFASVNHIVQVLKLKFFIPGSSVTFSVAVLYEHRARPGKCLVFNPEDWRRHGQLLLYMFRPRNANERFRMRDLLWGSPEVEYLTDRCEEIATGDKYTVRAIMWEGPVEGVSANGVYHG